LRGFAFTPRRHLVDVMRQGDVCDREERDTGDVHRSGIVHEDGGGGQDAESSGSIIRLCRER
jgi:hypothetical protein